VTAQEDCDVKLSPARPLLEIAPRVRSLATILEIAPRVRSLATILVVLHHGISPRDALELIAGIGWFTVEPFHEWPKSLPHPIGPLIQLLILRSQGLRLDWAQLSRKATDHSYQH
jgi:hypothetical protein